MTYHELVEAVRAAYAQADASGIEEHIAYQFNIEGEGEGAFYLEIKDGRINIEPYEYYDRDVLFTTKAETLLKIGTGKIDPIWAVTTGKLRFEGNVDKALKLKEITPKSVEVTAVQNAMEEAAPTEADAEEAAAPEDTKPEETAAPEDTKPEEAAQAEADPEEAPSPAPSVQKEAPAAKDAGAGFAKKHPAHKMKKKRR